MLRIAAVDRVVVAVVVLVLGFASCKPSENEVALPPPVPIGQWAERVDTLPGTYTFPSYPVEFWDSVVVIADGAEHAAWRIDLNSGERVPFGSKGGGPGEYLQSPGQPLKVGNDSVALILGPASSAFPIVSVRTGGGRTHHIPVPVVRNFDPVATMTGLPFVDYADTLGNVYGAPTVSVLLSRQPAGNKSGRGVSAGTKLLDTLPLVRISLATGKVDTLLRLSRGVSHGEVKRDANGNTIQSTMALGPYGPLNSWLPMADGRLLIAFSATYDLNILDPVRRSASGYQLSNGAVPVSKDAWNSYVETATTGEMQAMQKMQSEVFAKVGKAPPRQPDNRYVIPEMPSVMPPLQFGDRWRRMHVVDNVAWIPVNRVDARTVSHWDVVDLGNGARLQTIALPENQYLRGVTRTGVYVYAIDENDLQRILLYRRRSSAGAAEAAAAAAAAAAASVAITKDR